MDFKEAIDSRYSGLAKSCSCLSCGGARQHSNPQPGEICVDLGSGRGSDSIRLAESVGPSGYVYGIDISDGMIATARENVAAKNITTIEFIKSPIEVLPLLENSVNVVISNCTINHAKDKAAVWKEIFRVLKTGGRFVVSDIYSMEPVPLEFSTDPKAVAECWAGAITRNNYLTILKETGFADIEILEESQPYQKGSISVSSFTIRGYKF